jgi:hypothetical protein
MDVSMDAQIIPNADIQEICEKLQLIIRESTIKYLVK